MKALLWDLDGTLTDPQLGILRCIRFALESRGHHAPPASELLWCIGPPLHHSFARLVPGASEEEVLALVAKYRERFAPVGMFENEVCRGVPELLASLGCYRQFVATSKPRVFAAKIIEHFGLSRYFAGVYGSELSGERSDKSELIRFILARESISAPEAVMIGDRKYDILGARKAGVASAGITWGYGSREELEEAGAGVIFSDPPELGKYLLARE